MSPPMYLKSCECREVSSQRNINLPLQAIWHKELHASGHYHPKDMILDSFEIFLVLGKSCADNSKAATVCHYRVCQVKTANIAF